MDQVFGIRITGDGKDGAAAVQVVRQEVDRLSQSADKATSSAEKLSQATGKTGNEAANALGKFEAQRAALTSVSTETQRLIDRYDPLGAKLRQLKSDFAALNEAASSGNIPARLDSAADAAYRSITKQISATQQLMDTAGGAVWTQTMHGLKQLGDTGAHAHDQLANGAQKSAFATAQARRELIVLGHEAMTGNFSRMPGSVMVLAERMGSFASLLNPVTLGIAAVAGAAVGLVAAFFQGRKEMEEMNNALAMTSDYAGLTRGGMRELALQISQTGNVTVGAAKEIVTQLVASGRIGSDAIGVVARVASDYARVTGTDIDKIAPKLVQLFADPAKGAEELNRVTHSLTVTEIEQIKTLTNLGDTRQAQLILGQKVEEHLPKEEQGVNLVVQSYRNWKAAISGVLDALGGIGRTTPVEEQLKRNQQMIDMLDFQGAPSGNAAMIEKLKQANLVLMDQYVAEQKANKAATDHADELERQRKAWEVITQKAKAYALTQEELQLKAVQAFKPQNDAQATAKASAELAIRKQIAELQRSMGAEGRQLQQDQIAGEAKLASMRVDALLKENDAQIKLGKISQAQHDETKTSLELQKNAIEKSANAELQALKGITPLERQKLELKAQELEITRQTIQASGDNAAAISAHQLQVSLQKEEVQQEQEILKAEREISAASVKGYEDQVKQLDKLIQQQRLHNAEIGKTAEQKELEKQRTQEAAIAQMQSMADGFRAASQDEAVASDLQQQYRTTAALLDQLIARQRTLSTLHSDASVLEAQAAAAKEWKRANDSISRSLTDGLMRAFEAGKGYGEAFRDTLVNMFKTMILRPVIQFMLSPVTGLVTGAMQGVGFGAIGGTGASGAGSMMGSLGMSAAGSALGSWASGLIGGGLVSGAGSIGEAFSTLGATYSAASGLAAAGGAGTFGSMAAGGSAALAAMGPVGWGALALGALAASGAFKGGGRPKDSHITLYKDPSTGKYKLDVGNISDAGPSQAAFEAGPAASLTAALNDSSQYSASTLDQIIGPSGVREFGLGGPSSSAAALQYLTQQLAPAAEAAQQATQNLSQTMQQQAQLEQQRRQMEITLMQQEGDAAGALAAQRADELAAMDASLRPLQERINAVEDATKAQKDALQAALDAVGSLISASQSAADEARQIADSYRQISASLADAITTLRGGDLSPLLPAQKLSESGALLDQTFRQAMTGDQTALGKLPQMANDFLTASRAYNASSAAYTADFARVMDMLAEAQGVSQHAASAQDVMAGLLDQQTSVLKAIQTELQKPDPNTAVLSSQLDQLRALGGQIGDQEVLLGSGNAAQLAHLSDLNIGIAGLGGGIDRAGSLIQQLVDLTAAKNAAEEAAQAALADIARQMQIASATSAYTQAKSVVDTLLAQQRSYLESQGMPYTYTQATDISAGQAGQVTYQYSNEQQLSTMQSYSDQIWQAYLQARSAWQAIPGHAAGLPYVPYDGYVMQAHEGEAVIDAQSRAALQRYFGVSAGSGVTRADIDRLVQAMEETRAMIERAAAVSSRDIRQQTVELAASHKEAARETSRAIAGAVEVTKLA